MFMRFEEWIDKELSSLAEQGLERSLSRHTRAGGKFEVNGKVVLNFSSKDYLDLA